MVRGRQHKQWTAAGAARAARDARISTVAFLRDAPIARQWEASKLITAHKDKVTHLGGARNEAELLLFTGLGYSETWRPSSWMDAAEQILTDEARYLAEADLYILSPEMMEVVVAATQTLTLEDLSLLTADDLPSPSGLVVLPRPLLVKAPNGEMCDDRAYLWRAPVKLRRPDPDTGGWKDSPAVRISLYHDSHGPVRPDSFLDFANQARAQGTPLPPLLVDAMQCIPFETTATQEELHSLTRFLSVTQESAQQTRQHSRSLGLDEERIVGEYASGTEINDLDGRFTARFLYAFWRLCEQRIAIVNDAEVGHAARVTAERANVSPDVRVAQLRPAEQDDNPSDGSRNWQHRWVVRMHKVRQWYPSEQRHKVIYRGPYIKGPEDKPLLGGETVRGLVR